MLIPISQRDPKWANLKIGHSQLTIGAQGCALSCVSMATSFFGCFKNPQELMNFIDFTTEGLILWQTLRLPPVHFTGRYYGKQDSVIQASLNNPNQVCLIQVTLKSGATHWLFATGKMPLVNAYLVIDPWMGYKSSTLVYNNNITGFAIYSK